MQIKIFSHSAEIIFNREEFVCNLGFSIQKVVEWFLLHRLIYISVEVKRDKNFVKVVFSAKGDFQELNFYNVSKLKEITLPKKSLHSSSRNGTLIQYPTNKDICINELSIDIADTFIHFILNQVYEFETYITEYNQDFWTEQLLDSDIVNSFTKEYDPHITI